MTLKYGVVSLPDTASFDKKKIFLKQNIIMF